MVKAGSAFGHAVGAPGASSEHRWLGLPRDSVVLNPGVKGSQVMPMLLVQRPCLRTAGEKEEWCLRGTTVMLAVVLGS